MTKLVASSMAALAVGLGGSAWAADYYWDGLLSRWDTTTTSWLVDNAGDAVPFVPGNAMKVTKGTGAASASAASKVTFAQQMKPSEFIYDSSEDMTMDLSLGNNRVNNPLEGVKKFVKRGTGTLMLYKDNTTNGELGVPASTTVEVEEGALKVWTRNSPVFGSQANVIRVHEGAELWSNMYSSFGNPYFSATTRIHIILGGALKLNDNGGSYTATEQIGSLALEGGSVVAINQGDNTAATGYGVLGVFSDIYVTNRTTGCQTLTVDRNGATADTSRRITLNPVTPVKIHVDDVAEGDDLIFDTAKVGTAAGSMLVNDKSALTHTVEKVGAGTMRFGPNATTLFNTRVFDIKEGRFEFPRSQASVPNDDYTIRVHSGATFCIPMRNTLSQGYYVGYPGCPQKPKFHILGGTFIVGDLSLGNDGMTGSSYVGDELILSNATFETNLGLAGDIADPALRFGRLLSLDGEKPYEFKHYTDRSWALHADTYGGTEIRVADITGDDGVDVTIHQRFKDEKEIVHPYQPGDLGSDHSLVARPSGYTKTGPGTLKFTNRYNGWTGACEIREGAVVYQAEAPGDSAGTVFGNVTFSGSLTVKQGGTLIDEDANLGYYYSALADGTPNAADRIKLVVRLDGGKLLLHNVKNAANGAGSCWLYGPFVFKNGGSIEYDDPEGGNVYGQIAMTAVTVEDAETAAVHEIPKNPASGVYQNLFLYDTNLVFNVADSSHDGRTDLKVSLNPSVRLGAAYVADGGFIKRGAGTLSFDGPAAATYTTAPKGTVRVEEGTLLVNAAWGFHQLAGGVVVSSGAAIGGTGAVNALTLEAGASLAATVGQAGPLAVTSGTVTLPASGTIVVTVPEGMTDEQLERAKGFTVLRADGGLEGAANIANWTISIPGHEEMASQFHLTAVGNRIRCCGPRGMTMTIR